ncbi:hypothetical protein ScPMuIL_003510 [Solemya velum]
MVRVLNVAEKNDAAKSLSDIMSRGGYRKREGFSRYNKIYEFDYNILNQNCTMTMTSVSGHLLGLEFIGQYKKWHSCNPVSLFDVPVEKYCPQDFTDIKRTLEREIRGCQTLIIWTDCDREGENIGMEVVQVCTAVKPSVKVYRAHFSEMTPQAVARACRSLTPMDRNISDAVDVRQELDLRIGAAFTRFQTLRLQKIFPEVLADQLISYGSCQFPTLGFVVERYKQVQAFVSEPFWKIRVTHILDDTNVDFSWKRIRLFDHMACQVLYEHCIETPMATVVDVKSKSKSKWRPQPLDTVELEKLASRKLRINAKETMKIAEKLYTQGHISYPRTETNKFTADFDLANLIEQQTQDPNWGGFARGVLEQGPNPRNGNKTDQAHPPIHPTKYSPNLQGDERKLYEFIVRHFLATCSKDAQGMETTVEIDIAEERFTAQGLMIIAKNYLEVYPYEKWNAKVIPVYKKDDRFEPNSIEMNDGETSPPPLLTEADLIALMDKHEIGTDATHADHIETIKGRMYVGVRPDGRFVPGQLGMGLVEGYDAMGYEMSKPYLRAELEADLKQICEGKKNKDVVLRGQVQKYKEVFIQASQQALKIDEALSHYLGEAKVADTSLDMSLSMPVRKCPVCGQDMTLRTKKDGKGFYIGCMGYPSCRNAIWLPDFVLEASVGDQTCNKCQPNEVRPIKFKFRRGSVAPMLPSEYTGCIGGCDEILTQTLNIRSTPSANPTGTQTAGVARRPGSQPTAGTGSVNSVSASSHLHSNNRTNNSLSSNSTSGNNRQNPRGTRGSNNSSAGRDNKSSIPMVSVAPLSRNGTGTSVGGGTGGGGRMTGSDSGNDIMCNCGKGAVLLTVRKEGPNTGRQFYKCGDSSCQFFLWADEAQNQPSNPRRTSFGGNNPQYDSGTSFSQRPQNTSGIPSNQRPSFQSGGGAYGSDSDSTPNCNCGTPGRRCTVQKEGPNKGREFFGCPKPRGEGCGFFQWADEDGSGQTSPSRTSFGGGNPQYNNGISFSQRPQHPGGISSNQRPSLQSGGGAYGSDSDGTPNCNCGTPGRRCTVQKEGPNKGREFFGCPKPRGEGCGFFQWADEGGGGQTSFSRENSAGFMSSQRPVPQFGTHPSTGVPSCNCGEPSNSRTVMKEGPNKGRPFYCCSKPRGEGCNFFQWGDDDAGQGASLGTPVGNNRTASKKRPAPGGLQPAEKRARKCGLCGEEVSPTDQPSISAQKTQPSKSAIRNKK